MFLKRYVHSKSRNLLQKSQFENLTFSQMTFSEISHLNRTTPSHNQHVNLIGEGSQLIFSMRTQYKYINTFI